MYLFERVMHASEKHVHHSSRQPAREKILITM